MTLYPIILYSVLLYDASALNENYVLLILLYFIHAIMNNVPEPAKAPIAPWRAPVAGMY
jgi:hypothetical protein